MALFDVTVLGAGLAGCEAAWQLASRGLRVRLVEMKPLERTPAQQGDQLAELVCSNSLRSQNPLNAVGLLKEEMQRLGSFILDLAQAHRVPAGDALAVDRVRFGAAVTEAIEGHPNIEREVAVARTLPPATMPTIVATGPLTHADLAQAIATLTGAGSTTASGLYFYDAIAPIVDGETIDRSIAFAASRYGKGNGDDYLNCPLDRAQYATFIAELLAAETLPLHAFEEAKYFQGCQPAEVIAATGLDALRYGAMKPVGLTDPRTGRWPHAAVQLRQEDVHGNAYNLVGFQTKLKHAEQRRVLRLLPGLEAVQFFRYGTVHRNTYLDAPDLLDDAMALHAAPHLHFAGQITGVEGYVESAAHGLMTALLLAHHLRGQALAPPPRTCALGALWGHVRGSTRVAKRPHEPSNVHWGMFPPAPAEVRRSAAKPWRLARARQDLSDWAASFALPLAAVPMAVLVETPSVAAAGSLHAAAT